MIEKKQGKEYSWSLGPEEQIKEFAIYGTPEDVLRQIKSFEDAGIQYLIVDLDPSRELEALDVFKEVIRDIS